MQKLLVLLLLITCNIFASGGYQFLSPMPDSKNNTRESTIIIRHGELINSGTVNNEGVIVEGSLSGRVQGDMILSSDGKTVIFKPYNKFQPSETVTVTIANTIKTANNTAFADYSYSFEVTKYQEMPKHYAHRAEMGLEPYPVIDKKTTGNRTRVEPPTVTSEIFDEDALGEGKIFVTVNFAPEGIDHHVIVYNNDGSVYWSEYVGPGAFDFKVHPNGLMSYGKFLQAIPGVGGGDVIQMIMDDSFTIIDSVQMGNGYIAEVHEFLMLPNGHSLIMGYYFTPYDMTTLYPNGHPSAHISGAVLQELDVDNNVVWQWRSFDYYDIADASFNPNTVSREFIDAFHVNSMDIDLDNHMLIGTPGWAKKINRQTGETMYSIGEWMNEFTYVGVDSLEGMDNIGGHTYQALDNGNILTYDNGSGDGTRSSQVHEFVLDEVNKVATRVWTYHPDTVVAARAMGSAYRLPNGNTVIGWGYTSGRQPLFTEVDADGNKLMELSFDIFDVRSYRAYRFPIPNGNPSVSASVAEVAPGGEYDFVNGDNNTGISVEINNLSGAGYNELFVKRYKYSAMKPSFLDKAPRVIPGRIVFSQSNVPTIDCIVKFDLDEWTVSDPANAVIYNREFEGSGLFKPLATTYNSVKGTLEATTTKYGEFIIGTPDLESHTYAPVLVSPKNNSTVNQELSVTFEWAPVGFASSHTLEIASDAAFQNISLVFSYTPDAVYSMAVQEGTTYYWRVKSHNDVGDSDYSEIFSFTSTAPYIEADADLTGELFQRGLEYWVRWEDNIEEDVELALKKSDETEWSVIDTAESDRAYGWEIPVDLALGDYTLRITSIADPLITSTSGSFAIDDSTLSVKELGGVVSDYQLAQNYPNPFNPETNIQFAIPESGIIKLSVYDVLGRRITTLVNEFRNAGKYEVNFDASNLASGIYYYTIEANNFRTTKKMILMK